MVDILIFPIQIVEYQFSRIFDTSQRVCLNSLNRVRLYVKYVIIFFLRKTK